MGVWNTPLPYSGRPSTSSSAHLIDVDIDAMACGRNNRHTGSPTPRRPQPQQAPPSARVDPLRPPCTYVAEQPSSFA